MRRQATPSIVSAAMLAAVGCGGSGPVQPPPVRPPCLAEQVAAGVASTWVVKADGSAWFWGYGSRQNWPPPYVPALQSTWLPADEVGVFLRSDIMCVLSATQDLRCAPSLGGCNTAWDPAGGGCSGAGAVTSSTVPLPNVGQVSMGVATAEYPLATTNCAVKTDGTVWCFSGTDPVQGPVSQDTAIADGATAVSVGLNQRCAIKTDGSLWCWGDGFLGDGQDKHSSTTPVQAMVPSPAVGVSAAFNFTCALLNDSTVWCWGERGFCDASRQGEAAYLLPQSVGISDAKAVATGSCHACALKNDGSVWCWGSDYYGESGYGPGGDADAATWDTPRQVVELGNDVTFVAAGESHTCARKSDATIWCWGNSSWGQLGNNLVTNPSPIQMRGCE